MPLYFIAALSKPQELLGAAVNVFPEGDIHQITLDKFFVKFDGTSVELSAKLGLDDGSTGTGIVLLVTNYHGRAPKSVWEWVAQKQGAK